MSAIQSASIIHVSSNLRSPVPTDEFEESVRRTRLGSISLGRCQQLIVYLAKLQRAYSPDRSISPLSPRLAQGPRAHVLEMIPSTGSGPIRATLGTRLPVELIVHSAKLACLAPESTLEHTQLDYNTHIKLLTVNTLLHDALLPLLYAHIKIGTHPKLFALHRTLSQRPLLGYLVRSLCITPASRASSELAPCGTNAITNHDMGQWLIAEGVDWMPSARLPTSDDEGLKRRLESANTYLVRQLQSFVSMHFALADAGGHPLGALDDRAFPTPLLLRDQLNDTDRAVLDMEFIQIGVAWCYTCMDTSLLQPVRRTPLVSARTSLSDAVSDEQLQNTFIGAGTWGDEAKEEVGHSSIPDFGHEPLCPAVQWFSTLHGLSSRRLCRVIADKLESLDYTGVDLEVKLRRDAWVRAWRARRLRDDDICSPSIFARSGCLGLLSPAFRPEEHTFFDEGDSDEETDNDDFGTHAGGEDDVAQAGGDAASEEDGGPDTPSTRALFGSRVAYLSSEEEPTLGSIITIIQSLLCMMPELVALRLSSYLERVVGGRDSRRLWPKL